MLSYSKHIISIPLTILILIILYFNGCTVSSHQDGYLVPTDPPKSHYIIEASIDLEKGMIEGTQTVTLKNDSHKPLSILAVSWKINDASSIKLKTREQLLTPISIENNLPSSSPLFYRLPKPLNPRKKITLEITFKEFFEPAANKHEFGTTQWFPRIWWDGLPTHDSFSVKLDIPEGYALAASGRLDESTGRFEIRSARTFGIYLGEDQKTETREVDSIQITTLFTEKGAPCAAVLMDKAVDAVKFYKNWLGFYPFDVLYVIPGGSGPWGGYPFATGIVVIHGEETFKEGGSILHWQRIMAHEIGHQYWGEWVLDPDNPEWLWIGMGIFADTEYILARNIDPQRRVSWMSNYINGVSMYYDTTVDIPPAQLSKIKYDHSNTVVHPKGFSIISALDSVLGRETFKRIYKKALREYGGKRLGWRELQRFFEKESGQNLSWFFEQWVRSNKYLCYRIESQKSQPEGDGFLSTVKVKKLGTMAMPVPVKAVFEDGTEQLKQTDRSQEVNVLTFKSQAKLKEAILNPDKKLAMVENPVPKISDDSTQVLALGWSREDSLRVYKEIKDQNIENSDIWYRLGMLLFDSGYYRQSFVAFEKVTTLEASRRYKFAAYTWMGHLMDLLGDRKAALDHYGQALHLDTGQTMQHSQYRMRINRAWLEERLRTPFTWKR